MREDRTRPAGRGQRVAERWNGDARDGSQRSRCALPDQLLIVEQGERASVIAAVKEDVVAWIIRGQGGEVGHAVKRRAKSPVASSCGAVPNELDHPAYGDGHRGRFLLEAVGDGVGE